MSAGNHKIAVTVTNIIKLNELVSCFEFERTDKRLFPTFSGGAHTVIEMQDGDITRLNPYSLMSDPLDQKTYAISIRRDDEGRGGSLFMHSQVRVGDQMILSSPVNLFSLDLRAKKHLMIAGGIGITPFLAKIKQLERLKGNWELHYTCRSQTLGSYAQDLILNYPDYANVYFDEENQKIDLENILDKQPLGTHLYICGPKGMIEWVINKAEQLGWPQESIHYEEFLAPKSGKPFEVKLAISNKIIKVGEHQSLLEAIEAAGVDAPYLCRGGACGECETRVIGYDGKFLHNDHWLNETDRSSGKKIMPCVSRFEGKTLILDR